MKLVKRKSSNIYAFYSDGIYLTGLTKAQKDEISEQLTFENPAYEQALRFSPYDKVYCSKTLCYAEETEKGFRVPIGFSHPIIESAQKIDERIYNTVDFPEFKYILRDAQKEATDAYFEANTGFNVNAFLVLNTGMGKEQPLSAKVLTPMGFVPMGSIKRGDIVMGGDGNPTTVTGVFPQGVKDVYRVTFSDGYSAECGIDHLWTVSQTYLKEPVWNTRSLRDILTQYDLNEEYTGRKRIAKLEIPVTPIYGKKRPFIISPYILGVLIAEGSLTQGAVYFSICPKDSFILTKMCFSGNYALTRRNTGGCYQYRVCRVDGASGCNKYKNEIKRLGLDKLSKDKFIPEKYLLSSFEQRKQLLAALMDTDGSCVKNRSSYSTSSERLANDVVSLVQSLGGLAHIRISCRADKGTEYSVVVNTPFCPFSLPRKAGQWKPRKTFTVRRRIVKIEKVREEESQCIMVSSPLHQYITDNYVVTHNTSAALFIAQKLKQRTLILCHKLDLIDQFRDEANRAFDNKLKIGEYHGKKKTQGEQITIASFQTLARLDEKERVKFIDGYSLVVIDEAHVSAAQMFSLVNQSKARYKLGLTATPERNDGLTHLLFCFFGQPCYQSNKRAKNMDILPAEVVYRNINATVLPIVRRTAWGYKLSYYATSRRITLKKETTKEGYVSSQEEFIYDVPHAKRPKVDAFKIDDLFLKQAWETITDDVLSEYENGHSCLVMFKQKKHVDLFAETLSDYEDDNGNNVEYVKYYGDNADCASALKKAREQRRLITIATYSKVTEGTDCKQWECAFVASSIGNGKSTEQAVGRIRRSCDTPKLDKVKIYDYRAKDVYTYTTQARKRDERYAELGFTVKRDL